MQKDLEKYKKLYILTSSCFYSYICTLNTTSLVEQHFFYRQILGIKK